MSTKLLAIRAIFMGLEYLRNNRITNEEYDEFLDDDTIDPEEMKLIRQHRKDARQAAVDA